jgi:hypothetical protein
MKLDVADIGEKMIGAVSGVLKGQAPSVLGAANDEFRQIAHQIVSIGEGVADGSIKPEAAPILFKMQRESWKGAIIEVTGLAEILAENALNAALDVVKTTVNGAIGLAII